MEVTNLRPLRLRGAIHHVALRGTAGAPLFEGAAERERFDDRVGELLAAHDARAHAYCWMTNHVHLAIEAEPGRAASFQSALAVACGAVVPDTPPLLVDARMYLLQLVRYIHLNPVRAGLVTDPLRYRWCGHRVYLGYPGVQWLCTDHALRLLGGDLLWATAAYRSLMAYTDPSSFGEDQGWPFS